MTRIFAYSMLAAMLLVGCGSSHKNDVTAPGNEKKAAKVIEPAVVVPIFDADSAYCFIEKQLSFGPRVPNTASHRKCGDYLVDKLRSYGAYVVTQDVDLKAYTGDVLKARNIIAQFQPDKKERIMLFAHWDSRPWADSDPDKTNHYKPLPGANDGGSGVGVLLEVARHLSVNPTKLGIDIIFFDAEDYGIHDNDREKYRSVNHSWGLGSQHWAMNPHKKGYEARYGILLDIVGAKDSRFYQESYSLHFAPAIVSKVWDWAHKLGYKDFFVAEESGAITDDHYYVNSIYGIPCIDIINCDPQSPNGFGPYHHTMKDDMDWIDTSALKAVGTTVLTTIYNEK